MLDINSIYNFVGLILNKQQAGFPTPENFNEAIAIANLDFYKQKLGLPESFRIGLPYSPQEWQVSQIITDAVKQFFSLPTGINKDIDGTFHYPDDYVRYSSITIAYDINSPDCKTPPISEERFVEVVPDGEWVIRLSNTIIPPTLKYPICNFYSQGIKVAPKTVSRIYLSYLRKPVQPVRGYTLSANDTNEYDPATSTQLEWDEIYYNDIATLVLKYYGVSIRDESIFNYAKDRQGAGV